MLADDIPKNLKNNFLQGLAVRMSEIQAAWLKVKASIDAASEQTENPSSLLRYKLIKLSDASGMYGYPALSRQAQELLSLLDAYSVTPTIQVSKKHLLLIENSLVNLQALTDKASQSQ